MKKIAVFILTIALVVGIAVSAYAVGLTKQISATYGITVMLDGEEIKYTYESGLKAEAFVSDGVTYLPVRAIATSLGLDVQWEGATQTVILSTSTAPTQPPANESTQSVTTGQRNALAEAVTYLGMMPFSYSGLLEQLQYEGYSESEAKYGADNCGADWNEQAAKKAASYLSTMSFSRSGLIAQLEYDGFTRSQAEYGVSQNGY